MNVENDKSIFNGYGGMIMKKMKVGVMACSVFLIFGCVTFPAADNEHQTLIIGEIIQQGTGYQIYGSASVNGTNKSGIEITIRNITDGKRYTMRTGSGGIFYSVNIPEGTYGIERIHLRKESGSAWASITWQKSDDNVEDNMFEIINDIVNNLGTINWECESGIKNHINFNREYGRVRDDFQEKNKASNWLEKEWINTNIKQK
jgi:hypothetical protein